MTTMDEKDWILLDILYNEQNLTKTAERLYTSQPSITYRLNKIEEVFEIKLFNKRHKGITFTVEGEHLVFYARRMLKELQDTKDKIVNLGKEVQGHLRLGVSSNFAQYKLPKLLRNFSNMYPNVQFNVQTGWSTDVMKLLDAGIVQVGIIRGDHRWKGEMERLTKEKLLIISRDPINIGQLPLLPFIKYQTDNSLKTILDDWMYDNLVLQPNIAMEVDRQETCKEMVKQGLGYSIAPEICLRNSDKLYTMEIYDTKKKPLTRDTWLMYDQKSTETKTVKAFIEFLRGEQVLSVL